MSTHAATPPADGPTSEGNGRTGPDLAAWVVPKLRESVAKLADLLDKLRRVREEWYDASTSIRYRLLRDVGHLVRLHYVCQDRVTEYPRIASALAENVALDHETMLELAEYREVVEEYLRATRREVELFVEYLKESNWLEHLRREMVSSGQYKSPV